MSALARTVMACEAVLDRDLRAVMRSRSQLYSSMLFPLMLLAILGTGVSEGLKPTSSLIRNGDYVSYLVPGLTVMAALFSSTFSSASYYRDRDSGLLKAMLTAPHAAQIILMGKALAGVVIGSIQALAVLLTAAAIPGIDLAWQHGLAGIPLTVATVLLLCIILNGLAQALASRIRTMQGFHLVMNMALFPMLFFSGAFFPLDDLPFWLRLLGYINPLSYAVDALHLAAYAEDGGGHFGLFADLTVLSLLAVALFFGGMRRTPTYLA